jgi:endoglucanase
MKKIFMLISALVVPFLGMSQKDGLEENFNDNVLKNWQGSARYTLAVENGELKVETDVLASRYDGFKFFFPDTLDLTLVPYVKIKIKSAKPCSVRMDLQDINGKTTNQIDVVKSIPGGNQYHEYTYNFSGLFYQLYPTEVQGPVDQKKIRSLEVLVNAGKEAFQGDIYFDDILIGSSTGIEPPPGKIVLNQAGFYPDENKVAIVTDTTSGPFYIVDALSGDTVFSGMLGKLENWRFIPKPSRKAEFTEFDTPGKYRLAVPALEEASPSFEIKEEVHHTALKASLKSYYYQRASIALVEPYAGKWARPAGHPDNVVLVHSSAATAKRPAGTKISTPGGWYDAGDYGKYIVNSGISTYQLLALYEHFPTYFDTLSLNIPESNNQIPDILDECLWNLRWMLTMQDEDGGVYHKTSSLNHDGDYMPHQSKNARYVIGKGTAATLDYAAIMAQAARIFRKFDAHFPQLADSMIHGAIRAYDWAEKNPSVAFANPAGVSTGEYGNTVFTDEFSWARAELLISTFGNQKYYNESDYAAYLNNSPSWPDVAALGMISLAHHRQYLPAIHADSNLIKNKFIQSCNQLVNGYNSSAFGVAMGQQDWQFTWGGNAIAGSQGMVLIQAYRLTNDKKYLDAALSNLDYLLGRNGTGYSFLTGIGEVSVMNPHHRPSYKDGIVEPVPGLMVGGPHSNSVQGEGCSEYPGSSSGDRYIDDWCSFSTNENAINYNSAFTYLAGAIEALRLGADYTPPVATRDAQKLNNLTKVYPNPATGVLNIQSDFEKDVLIKITDISGREFRQEKISARSMIQLDISQLSKGIYVISTHTGSMVFTEKVIVR